MKRGERPLYLCKEPSMPMYIARMGDQFVTKSMTRDDPICYSCEPATNSAR